MASGPHVAYVSADRGVPVLGTKGGSTHVRELVNALCARGAEVQLVAVRPTDGDAHVPLAARVIDVSPERFSRTLRHRIQLAAPGQLGETIGSETAGLLLNHRLQECLRRLHVRWHIDVIYERYSLWGFAGLAFAREHGVPFVLEVNAPLRIEQARFRTLHNAVLAEALESQLFQLADRVVVPSSALREYVIERGARTGRVRVVPNAADPTFFRRPGPANGGLAGKDAFVVGFLGSLKPWHGMDDLLVAFSRLHRRDPAYRLLIVGDGPQRPAIETTCRRERVAGSVRITGNVSYAEIPRLLWQMDVGLAPYPSLPDFYFSPLKIYEYMAARVPIVASAIGQISEILTHRQTALLHPPGNIGKMVEHIERLRAHPGLRARLARQARRLMVKRFTWDRNAARVLAMVDSLRRAKREGRYAPAEESLL